MIAVRPTISWLMASWIIFSVIESRLDVASSRISIEASAMMARAMATR